MRLKLDDYLILFNNMINNIKYLGIEELVIDEDYYWYLDPDEAFDMHSDKPELVIGSLYEDIEQLKNNFKTDTNILINTDIEKMAYLLFFLSKKISSR